MDLKAYERRKNKMLMKIKKQKKDYYFYNGEGTAEGVEEQLERAPFN